MPPDLMPTRPLMQNGLLEYLVPPGPPPPDEGHFWVATETDPVPPPPTPVRVLPSQWVDIGCGVQICMQDADGTCPLVIE